MPDFVEATTVYDMFYWDGTNEDDLIQYLNAHAAFITDDQVLTSRDNLYVTLLDYGVGDAFGTWRLRRDTPQFVYANKFAIDRFKSFLIIEVGDDGNPIGYAPAPVAE